MAAGHHPGERESRRRAAIRLSGKTYHPGTAAADVHRDLRTDARTTLCNLGRAPSVGDEHNDCAECTQILSAAAGDPTIQRDGGRHSADQ